MRLCVQFCVIVQWVRVGPSNGKLICASPLIYIVPISTLRLSSDHPCTSLGNQSHRTLCCHFLRQLSQSYGRLTPHTNTSSIRDPGFRMVIHLFSCLHVRATDHDLIITVSFLTFPLSLVRNLTVPLRFWPSGQ